LFDVCERLVLHATELATAHRPDRLPWVRPRPRRKMTEDVIEPLLGLVRRLAHPPPRVVEDPLGIPAPIAQHH
jgi:hypothetical protein